MDELLDQPLAGPGAAGMPSIAADQIAGTLAGLARELEAEQDTGATLEAIVQAAIALIPGADAASISVVVDHARVEPQAASSQMARQIDLVQTQAGEGPCLDAIYAQTTVSVPDMESEVRWPSFAARACELGAGSMLSFQLYVHGDTLGALNLFAARPDAFGEESERVGLLFAAHAAVAFAGVRLQQQLASALAASEQQSADLSRSNADLHRFAYLASHDLQAPLREIGGFTRILAQSVDRGDLPEQRQLMASILGGVTDMNYVIRDLLAYERLKAALAAAVSLRETHNAAVVSLASEIAGAGARVLWSGGDQLVSGDSDQLRWLVGNLIRNSIAYRSPERPAVVTTSARTIPGAVVELAVSDNGIGIAPRYHQHVFDMFSKLHKGAGTGVGLAVVARIAELHGGSVTVESDGSSGTTFRVRLPRAQPAPDVRDHKSTESDPLPTVTAAIP